MPSLINSQKSDLGKIAVCHKSAFPDSLSSKMGINYLKKMIEWYISDDTRLLFHIEENGKCIGYCGGMINDGTQATGSASGMIQYSFNDAIKSLLVRPWLLFDKELISKFSLVQKNIKMRMKKKEALSNKNNEKNNSKTSEPSLGLVVIGVSKEYRGKGYGSLLLNEFEKRAKEKKFTIMHLTVRNDNHSAIKSYERNGWIRSKLEGNSLEMYKKTNQ